MAKAKKSELTLTISKDINYKNKKCILGLDDGRELAFNSGQSVEVTEEELNLIGQHRWLITGADNVNKNIK